MTTVENRLEEKLRKLLRQSIAAFFKQFEEDMQDRLYDKIGESDILPDKMRNSMIMRYLIRDAIEEIYEKNGPDAVRMQFEHIYYQIAARHIGGETFTKTHVPLCIHQENEQANAELRTLMKKKGVIR